MKNHLFDLPLEMQFLLACCRLSMQQDEQKKAEELEQLSVLSRQVDWSTFMKLIDRHRVHSLAHHYLKAQTSNTMLEIPEHVYLTLKTRFRNNKRRMLKLAGELVRLSKLFGRHDLFMLAFKGPALSQHLFGDLGLRYSKDLDLLIKPSTLDQVEQLLLSSGYRRQVPHFALTPRQKKAYLKGWEHASFYHAKRQTLIEVHWRLFLNHHLLPPAYTQQMIETSQPLSMAGTQITVFSDEDRLLYLCLHGAKHGWSDLKWLCDVAQFLHHKRTINWSVWVENVRQLGVHRPIAQALCLAHQLFDAPLPPATRLLIAEDKIVPELVAYAIELLMQSEEERSAAGQLNLFRQMPYQMKLKADLRYKWSTLSPVWHSVNDWNRYPLPDSLFPLYQLLRPFSFLRRTLSS